MLRSIAVAVGVAALSLAFVATAATEASARGPGGFRGGFTGARVGGPGFSPGFRSGFAGPGFRGAHFANPGFRRFGPGFRRFGYGVPLVGLGAYGAYSYYNNYDDCVVPQTVLTPYGYRTRLVNVCGYY